MSWIRTNDFPIPKRVTLAKRTNQEKDCKGSGVLTTALPRLSWLVDEDKKIIAYKGWCKSGS